MKPFQTYIYELNKKYEFRVKMGMHDPKSMLEQIKQALDTYQLESISAIKSLPIQEHREFPQWGPCECYTFDFSVAYPVTTAQLRQTLKERARINPEWIVVRNLNEAEATEEAESLGKDHKGALLDEEELGGSTEGQGLVGKVRVGSLLKELESRKFEFAAEGETTGVMSSDEVDTSSPVGTTQNTVYKKPRG